jgi:hypothetical protein
LKIFFAIFGLLIFTFEIQAQDYNCEKLNSDETTRQGYFETVEIREEKSFPFIQGVAELSEQPAENVFVEVFADKNPNRVAGCRTGISGKFSFPNLKKGSYTIRLSKDGGYKITEIKVKVSPKSKNRKDIIGEILVGV